jgi:HD-like signal output (HDOD) protein
MNSAKTPDASTANVEAASVTAESLVKRLEKGLQTNGDFPVSAKVINEISSLVKDPNTTADQLSTVILKDPTLGARLLSVVNSSLYSPGKPIMKVSQAIVHLGMGQLADLCANLILMQSFVPQARAGGAFAECLRKTILTSVSSELLSLQLSTSLGQKRGETGYLLGFFAEMGSMLLAFYYPNTYGTAVKRAQERNMELSRSVQQLIGATPIQIGQDVVRAMKLPEFFAEILGLAAQVKKNPAVLKNLDPDKQRAVQAVYLGEQISGLLVTDRRKKDLNSAMLETMREIKVDPTVLAHALTGLPNAFQDYCQSLNLIFPSLPEYLSDYATLTDPFSDNPTEEDGSIITEAVAEIREALKAGEGATSIYTAIMEVLAWTLGFDRVVLLLLDRDKKRLHGHMCLGNVGDLDPRTLVRSVGEDAGPYAPDAKAVNQGGPIFHGDPLLKGGWPFVVLPVGAEPSRVQGVIYADKVNAIEDELSLPTQAALSVLSDLLDQTTKSAK